MCCGVTYTMPYTVTCGVGLLVWLVIYLPTTLRTTAALDGTIPSTAISATGTTPLRILSIRMRIVPGRSRYEGRVEFEINGSGEWGTVCDHGWDNDDATVICRSFGFGPGYAAGSAYFGQGSGKIWLDEVNCKGTEASIQFCGHRGWGVHNCTHSQDAGVSCTPPNTTTGDNNPRLTTPRTGETTTTQSFFIRIGLYGGRSPLEGRVEIEFNGKWGTVCDHEWDDTDADVVCRMFGYSSGVAVKHGSFGTGSGPIWLDEVNCLGSESTIQLCGHRGWGIHSCKHSDDAGVRCTPGNTTEVYALRVRLVPGMTLYEGRVEFELNYSGDWGTVCDHGWDDNDATVICRIFGYGTGVATAGGVFGSGTGPILLDQVKCKGTESTIRLCGHRGWGVHSCTHSDDAGVRCAGLPTDTQASTTITAPIISLDTTTPTTTSTQILTTTFPSTITTSTTTTDAPTTTTTTATIVLTAAPVFQSCSDQVYNKSRERCCEDEEANIFDKHPFQACCRSVSYNYVAEVCCQASGTVYKPQDMVRGYSCCYNQLYKTNDQICCGRQVWKKNGYSIECCGSSVYDYVKHLCCDGHIRTRPSYMSQNYACCGTEVYNTRNELCCNDRIKWKSSSYDACCGADVYNAATALCCVRPSPLPENHGHMYSCCGSGIYNHWSELCCAGFSYPVAVAEHACCGVMFYKKVDHMCCNEQLVDLNGIDSNNTLCCGNGIYDVFEEICCNGNKLTKQYGSNSACCATSQYDLSQAVCCGNRIIPLSTWLDNGSRCN